MTSVHRQSQVATFCLALVGVLLLAGFCFGQPAVSLSPKDGPPTTTLRVSGSGFTPYAQIDIYFDSQDQALAVADAAGDFSQVAIQTPKSAVPGSHWVTASERSGNLAKQEIFEVHVNWTEFLTNDMHRENPYENVLNVDNVGSLRLKGSYTTWPSVSSSPAVVNGVVYVGSDDTNMYALDSHTGAKLWSYHTGGGVTSSPAVGNGMVYFGSWDNSVYALDARTGAPMWSYTTDDDVYSSPAVANGVVYVGSFDDNVYALDASTGALMWSYKTGNGVASSPAVANGMVYVGAYDGNVYALDTSTGALLWSYKTLAGFFYSSPAVVNRAVYVVEGLSYGNVYALNARTGTLLWRYQTGEWVNSSPAVANGVVYVVSGSGNVYALDARTGTLLWSYQTGYEVLSSPAVANGVVYVGSGTGYDGNIYALDASTGAKLWNYKAGGVKSSPAVANGVVYVGSDDGNVYAFGLPKGLAKEAPKRPDPKMLRPDFNLKPVSTVATD